MDLAGLLADYGPYLVFVILLLDSTGLPLPTEASLLVVGLLISQNRLAAPSTLAAALAASGLGCAISYQLGAALGTGWIVRWGDRFGLTEDKLRRAEQWLLRYGAFAVFLSRFVPFVRCLAGYPSGMARMPFGRYMVLSLLGYSGWISLSVLGGYLLGENWHLVVEYTEVAVAVGVALIAGFVVRRTWRRRRARTGRG